MSDWEWTVYRGDAGEPTYPPSESAVRFVPEVFRMTDSTLVPGRSRSNPEWKQIVAVVPARDPRPSLDSIVGYGYEEPNPQRTHHGIPGWRAVATLVRRSCDAGVSSNLDLLQRGHLRGSVTVLVFLALVSACQEGGSVDRATASRVDSAGIEIVTSPNAERVFARLDTAPDLSLGGVDIEGPTQFSEIGGVLSIADGSIWVRDGSTAEIRVFDRDGTHVLTLGGRGEGPEEFRSPVLVGKDPSDSVVVHDARLQKVVWYSPDGTFARSVPLRGRSPTFHGVLPGGRLVGELPIPVNPSTLTDGDLLGDTTSILVWDTVGDEPREIADLPAAPLVLSNMAGAPLPFRAKPGVAVGERIHTTAGAAYAIQVFDTDGLLARYRLTRDPRSVTEEAETAHRDALGTRGPEAFATAYLQAMEHPRVPDVLPAYDRLVLGADGSIWASEWTTTSSPSSVTWHVYDHEGVFEGAVEIPGDFELHVALADAVLGVWKDELDVEYVQRYRLIRP